MWRLLTGLLLENQAPLAQSIELIGKEEQDRTENDYDGRNIKRKSRDQWLYSFEDRRFRSRLSCALRLGAYSVGGLRRCGGSLGPRPFLHSLSIFSFRLR